MLNAVADPSNPSNGARVANRKKKPPRRERHGRNINVWVEDALGASLDHYFDHASPEPTLTAVIEAALKDFLRKHGSWPLPAASQDD